MILLNKYPSLFSSISLFIHKTAATLVTFNFNKFGFTFLVFCTTIAYSQTADVKFVSKI